MKYSGVLKKMTTENSSPVQYYFEYENEYRTRINDLRSLN